MSIQEEDEIIEEVDVYFCGELNDELAVLQYPLRPSDRFYGDYGDLSAVTVNKENMNVKFNYTIESKQKNFDTHYYEQKNYSQVLLGQKIDANTNYCVGIFRNNCLFLNPISNFIQFRHDFSNLEGNELLRRKTKDSRMIARKESMSGIVDPNKENQWINLNFYKNDSIQSYQLQERLYFDDESKIENVEYLNNSEYSKLFFENVNKETIIDKINENANNDRNIPYRELMKQHISLRVEYILKKLPVLNFYSLKKYCLAELVEDNVFLEECLKFSHMLKNGNLILKSDVRYDPSSGKDIILKRDYMINLLQNNNDEGIKRCDIKFLDTQEISQITSEICESSNGLLFLKYHMSENRSFIDKFEKIYQNEMNFWESILKTKKEHAPPNVISINLVNGHSSKHEEENTQIIESESNSTKNGLKFNFEAIKTSINQAFIKIDCINKDILLTSILNNFHIGNDEDNKDIINAIEEVINTMCIIHKGVCFIKNLGEGEICSARKILIEFLSTKQNGAKKAEIKIHLETNSIIIKDNDLNKILRLIANSISSAWQLKDGKNK